MQCWLGPHAVGLAGDHGVGSWAAQLSGNLRIFQLRGPALATPSSLHPRSTLPPTAVSQLAWPYAENPPKLASAWSSVLTGNSPAAVPMERIWQLLARRQGDSRRAYVALRHKIIFQDHTLYRYPQENPEKATHHLAHVPPGFSPEGELVLMQTTFKICTAGSGPQCPPWALFPQSLRMLTRTHVCCPLLYLPAGQATGAEGATEEQ